jgi:hypothetical protein
MEMENMLQMMKHMMTRQEEAEANAKARHEEAEARQQWAEAHQEKADANAKACHEKAEVRQQRAEARQEKINAEMKASQERTTAEMKAVQAEIKAAYAEMEAWAEARNERFLARLDGLTSYGEGTMTCQTETTSSSEEMEATNLESTPEATEAAVERQELFEEETNFDTIGSSEDRCEVQRLAVRHRRGAKKRSQGSVGSRQKLSAAWKRVIRRAVPAVQKGNIRKVPGRSSVGRVHPKSRTFGKKQRSNSECGNGRLDRDFKKRLGLRIQRKSGGNSKKTTRLEMVNPVVGSINGVQGVYKTKQTPWPLVRERTIPTDRPPLVDEI